MKELYCNYCGYRVIVDKFGKIKGTYIHVKGNKYIVLCNKCQSILWKTFKNKEDLIKEVLEKGKIKDLVEL